MSLDKARAWNPKETGWREFNYRGGTYRISLQYGNWTCLDGSSSFEVTYKLQLLNLDGCWRASSVELGIEELVNLSFPELGFAMRWRESNNGVPSGYLSDALYWFSIFVTSLKSKRYDNPERTIKELVIFGADSKDESEWQLIKDKLSGLADAALVKPFGYEPEQVEPGILLELRIQSAKAHFSCWIMSRVSALQALYTADMQKLYALQL